MINDFIRNLGFVFLRRFTHHKRVEHYYLSLVCTLATRLSTSVILRLVSSFYLRRGSNSQSSDSYSEAFPLSYEGMLGVRWVSIPLPLESQSSTLPIELQTPYKSRLVVSNHSKVGYEPTLIPDHTGVEESSGNDPQSVSHRSHCLANKSRRLQGLLSIVLIIGLEPITSDVSGRRSHQLSYMSGCGLDRDRTYDLRVNSSLLYL